MTLYSQASVYVQPSARQCGVHSENWVPITVLLKVS